MKKTTLVTILAFTICVALGTGHAGAVTPTQITVTGADLAAGQGAQNPLFASGTGIMLAAGASRPAPSNAPALVPAPFGFYPADVQNPFGNPTLAAPTVHNIFVDPYQPSPGVYSQGASGGPLLTDAEAFVNALDNSFMIHIADQYTGVVTSPTLGPSGVITYIDWRHTQYDADVAILVHAAARTFGTGLTHLYHIYFPQGMDLCTSGGGSSSYCYSPDFPATFSFCGYHSYFNFSDIGTVIFSVEPYANVNGCRVPTSPAGASPNGPAIDSMANVLSHETFEAITDPMLNAWFNRFGPFAGNEIGDECANVFALPPVQLNGIPYQIQAEYSNIAHPPADGGHLCTWITGI